MNTHTTELEFKFVYDAHAAHALARAGYDRAHAHTCLPLRSTYYDTQTGALAQARVGLRLRRTPQGYVQTVKSEGATAFERFEHESPVAGPRPERSALPAPDTPSGVLVHAHFDALQPLFVARFERARWRWQASPSLALELSVDVGEIRACLHAQGTAGGGAGATHAGWARAPIAELEIERLSGTRLEFLEWVLRFARQHRLRMLLPSKQTQGLRLCGRLPTPPAPAPGAASPLHSGQTVDQASAAALQTTLAHLLANLEALRLGQDPEAVHQLHLALQHFRTTLRVFALQRRSPQWDALAEQAHALADTVGQARDVDVFDTGTLQALRAAFPDDPALPAFAALAQLERAQARLRCRQTLCGSRGTQFFLAALYLTEGLAPVVAPANYGAAAMPATPQAEPLKPFLQKRLRRLWVRLRTRLRKAHGPHSWHCARLAAKQLRYALELARPVLPHPQRVARLLKGLLRLQQRLGDANDHFAALGTARRVAALATPGTPEAKDCARALLHIKAWCAQSAPPSTYLHAAARKTQSLLEPGKGKYLA